MKLVIEIDGAYHFEEEQKVKDTERQKLIEEMGLYFLRFSEQQVRKDMDIVLKEIGNYIAEFKKRNYISAQNVSTDSKYVQENCYSSRVPFASLCINCATEVK